MPKEKAAGGGQASSVPLSGDHGKRLVVLDAVVGREHIGHIAARKDEHGQQYDSDDFECLFHDSLLWIF